MLYVGREAVPHAAASVAAVRAAGMRVAFVTNNASRSPQAVAEHLVELGIEAVPADVVTSGQAAVRLVAERVPPGSAVLVLGSAALEAQLRQAGLRPVRSVAEADGGAVAAVVQGLEPRTCWQDLAEAAVAVRAGALWVAGNTDSTLPSPRGPLPGNGALVAALAVATGAQPIVAGKPEPALHRESVERTGARRPLVVGDRLDTDVLGAVRAGAQSLLVLTGVVDLPALVQAPAGCRPGFVAPDLRGLLLPHPPVELAGDRARCGRATARYADGVLELQNDDDDGQVVDPARLVQQLRVQCALAWALADRGLRVEHLAGTGPAGG